MIDGGFYLPLTFIRVGLPCRQKPSFTIGIMGVRAASKYTQSM